MCEGLMKKSYTSLAAGYLRGLGRAAALKARPTAYARFLSPEKGVFIVNEEGALFEL